MGEDAQAYLGYGYDLGGSDAGWQVTDPSAIDRIKEQGNEGFFNSACKNILLKELAGFTVLGYNDPARSANYYESLREAEKRLEVAIQHYGSWDYGGFMLIVKPYFWAYDWTPKLIEISLDHSASLKLDRALKALGITPTQAEPKWILAPFYG